MRALLAGALFTAANCAEAGDWISEPAASSVELKAQFEQAPVPGRFKRFDARIHFAADKPNEGRIMVTVDVRSTDFDNGDINQAIAGSEWFDAARFPQAEFRSSELRKASGAGYLASGRLTLKGVTQAIEVPFTWAESGRNARMTGELTLQRGRFGIGTGEWAQTSVIGADVQVRFDLRLHPVP